VTPPPDAPDPRLCAETERLWLRPPQPSDFQVFVEIHDDREVLRFLPGTARPGDRGGAWRAFAVQLGHWQIRGYGQWAVVEKASGVVIGRVGLWYPEGWPDVEVGWLIRRSHWGCGFATEAARASVAYAFDTLGLDHVISLIRPENKRSIRVAQKIGETLERTDVQEGRDLLVYGLHAPRRP
jgi:RimJ/RimL family protein N-acetyltransferase